MNSKNSQRAKFSEIINSFVEIIKWSFRANKLAFSVLLIFLTIVSLLPFVASFVQSKVIDEITKLIPVASDQRVLNTLIVLIAVGIVLAVVEKILWAVISLAEKIQYFDLGKYIEIKFLKKAASLDTDHYENPKTSQLIQKVKDIYEFRPRNIANRLVWMSGDLIKIISTVAILFTFSIPAFLVVVITSIPSLIAGYKLGYGSWGIWDSNAIDKKRYWSTKDMLSRESSLMELRIFNARNFLFDTVQSIYDRFTSKEKRDQSKRAFIESLIGNLSTLGYLIFWIIGIFAAVDGKITIGLLTFYVASINSFSSSLSNFFRSLSSQYEDSLYLVDFFKFMNIENVIKNGNVQLKNTNIAPEIVFKNVSFRYPRSTKYILKNFNLTIKGNERIALVGVNGAGKTTIIKLLCRFYDVNKGQILIDGIDIKKMDLENWYQKIGVLFQDFVKYSQFDVQTNIELGDVEKIGNQEKLNEAILKADAQDFINEYKHKLEQILDKSFDEGVNPSGGQWQRIALARAFFRDAPVLILDEPTSAIDAKGENEIFERLYEFSQGKTVIIVSHRFSTVRQADKIYVIDQGKIVEQGTHEHLIQEDGKYAKLFKLQAKGYQ